MVSLQINSVYFHSVKVPTGSSYLRCSAFNTNDVNTIITNFYQIGPISFRSNALLDLLISVAEEPIFDILRSKEQLGYDVSCSLRDNHGILGYTIIVNSQENKFSVDHVDDRIENFRQELISIIRNMPPDDFQQYKDSLAKIKLTEDNELKDEVERNWAEITTDEYAFDRAQREVDALRTLTQEEFSEFYSSQHGDGLRKLSVQVIGNPNGKNNDEQNPTQNGQNGKSFNEFNFVEFKEERAAHLIRNILEFKQTLQVYPISRTPLE